MQLSSRKLQTNYFFWLLRVFNKYIFLSLLKLSSLGQEERKAPKKWSKIDI